MMRPATVYGGGRFATARTTAMGVAAERYFYDICRGRRYAVRPATSYENRVEHFDFEVQGMRIEVKAMKAPRRGMRPDPNIIYVELRNVDGGRGWLYGSADYIAFEQRGGFLMVQRRELVRLAEHMAVRCRKARVSGVYHTLYSRANRADLVLVLHIDDVLRMRNTWFLRTLL